MNTEPGQGPTSPRVIIFTCCHGFDFAKTVCLFSHHGQNQSLPNYCSCWFSLLILISPTLICGSWYNPRHSYKFRHLISYKCLILKFDLIFQLWVRFLAAFLICFCHNFFIHFRIFG
jgi:hypothetical protein